MLKRLITYENPFTEQEVTEEHYFHISKADLVEMEIEMTGEEYHANDGENYTGMQAKLQRIVDTQDGKAIIAEFKDIIRRSYGKKDGDRFLKTEEAWKDFESSEAFSQLIFDLCTKPDESANFINGVIPSNLDQIAADVQAQAEKITAGRAAQEEAKASAASPEVATTPATPAGPSTTPADQFEQAKKDISDRRRVIAEASAENPVTLTEAEVREMDSDEFKSGLATGRYKLS